MFDDMTTRGHEGKHHYTAQLVETPKNLQWYVSGFTCVDQSAENRTSQKPLQLHVTEDSGSSTRTLLASFAYIRNYSPDRFVLENPHRRHTVQTIRSCIKDLHNYLVVMFVVNSKSCGAPCSRPRMYVVGINVDAMDVLLEPEKWSDELERIFTKMHAGRRSWDTYVLPRDSPVLQACLVQREGQTHARPNGLARTV